MPLLWPLARDGPAWDGPLCAETRNREMNKPQTLGQTSAIICNMEACSTRNLRSYCRHIPSRSVKSCDFLQEYPRRASVGPA